MENTVIITETGITVRVIPQVVNVTATIGSTTGTGGGGGVTDHGDLTGLADDDHTQYLNNTRGDARYSQLGHTHVIANVTGLQTALDGKAASSHTHVIAGVTGLQTALDGKAASSHTHPQSDITNLTTDLAGKQETLVSGTNIKTINGATILGSGDLAVSPTSGTMATRLAIATPSTGQQFFQTNVLRGLYSYNGEEWQFLGDFKRYAVLNTFESTREGFNTSNSGTNSGAGSSVRTASISGKGGVLELSTGTATTGYSTYQLALSGSVTETNRTFNSIIYYSEHFALTPSALSDATDAYTFFIGVSTSSTSVAFPAFGFRYTHSVNSGRFETVTRAHNSGSLTTKDTGVTFTANTWFKFSYELDGYANEIRFYINDVLVTTHTTSDNIIYNGTITWGVAIPLVGAGIVKSAGTNPRLLNLKYAFSYITKFTL